jgi:hypothetical protein
VNVHSTTFDVLWREWGHVGTVGTPGDAMAVTRYEPLVTDVVTTSGAVIVYKQVADSWVALPVTIPQGNSSLTYSFSYEVDSVRIEVHDSDLNTTIPVATQVYRLVTIEDP